MAHRQRDTRVAFKHVRLNKKVQQQGWLKSVTPQSVVAGRKLVVLLGLLLVIAGCRPAQIGPSDEVLGAVDALYTAIASRRVELLDKSASRIEELHTSGELPDAAHRQLKSYIEKSRAGKWDAAIRELHEFIRGQRRAKT